MRKRFLIVLCLLAAGVFEIHRQAAVSGADSLTWGVFVDGNFNLPTKTAGGTQVWTDHVWRDGYRVQQNQLTGHWRLLDPDDVRRCWGSRDQVNAAMEAARPAESRVVSDRPTVVLVHGLMRTHHSFARLGRELQAEGYTDVIRFSYASTRTTVADHAAALAEVLADQPAETRFAFVGHSLGNIVIRHLVGDLQRSGDPAQILPRCRAMVMLGPPNQGAAIARRLAPTGVFGVVTGDAGISLGPQWETFKNRLSVPPFPFAIVAGDVSANSIQNPLVDGASDFVVSVAEARLEGAVEVLSIPVLHSFLMADDHACRYTREFLARYE